MSVIVTLALAACHNDPGPVPVELIEDGVRVCSDPDLRNADAFDYKSAASERHDQALLHGGGLLVEDLDDNGFFDLFLPSETEHDLRWGRDGDLEQLFDAGAADIAGLPLDFSVGVNAVDYDADGDLDVFVTRWERPNTLLRNDGDRRFTDVSATAFPDPRSLKSQSASWGDIEGDGDLDLFVGSYGKFTRIDVNDPVPDCSDHDAEDAELWRNNGDGTFTDISDALPHEVHEGYTFMSGFYDIDGDRYPELFVANDDGKCQSSLVVDNVGGAFAVEDFNPGSHDMGMAVADLNDDEIPDFLLTSFNTASLARSSVADDGRVFWVDYSDAMGLTVDATPPGTDAQHGQQVYGWGAEFGDIDNDADIDATMLFGYWHYYTGKGNVGRQADGLWIQGDDGMFSDEGPAWGVADEGTSRGVVLADIDNDGYLDMVKRILDAPTPLYVSRCGEASWVRIRLSAPGPNTFGVGAKIRVITGDKTQIRWIHSGSSGMYSGAPLEAHVGLGDADRIDRIEVVWPDGRISAVEDVAARQKITVVRLED